MGNKMCCSPGSSQNLPSLSKAPKVMAKYKLSGCDIVLTFGQIIYEDVDAIVLVANSKLKLAPNLQKILKAQGGQSIQEELNKILIREGGRLDYGQVVYTHSGDLDYDFIFYAVLPSCCDSTQLIHSKTTSTDFQPSNSLVENLKCQNNIFEVYFNEMGNSMQKHEKQHVFECIMNTLTQADQLGLTSIAFPIMEPSNLHISKSLIATMTLVAIKTYVKETKQHKMTNIHISIQDMPTMHLFKWAFQQIIIEDSATNAPLSNSQHLSHQQNNHYFDMKGSYANSQLASFDMGPEDIIRFGHGISEKSRKQNADKNSI